jgi:predicted small lipoprotein YifL
MMKKNWLWMIAILMLISLACGSTGKKDQDNEQVDEPAAAENDQTSDEEEDDSPSKSEKEDEVDVEEEMEQDSSEEEPEDISEDDIQEEPVTVNSDAPAFFRDELDGELDEVNWTTEYHYWVDEDVEEEDEEAIPVYTIEQERGALKFDLESPWLYIYRMYNPHKYKDVRIDLEVENKGVNTNNISLVCRSTDYGWYEFIATSGGYYSIMRYYEDGNEELAYGGIKSIKFGDKKKNVFTAICDNKTLTYIVNDVEIKKVKDEEIMDEGFVGFNVSAEEVLPVKVEINWLEISEP